MIAETPELPLTMTTVLRMFTSTDWQERLARMIEQRRRSGNPYSQPAVDQVGDSLRGEVQQVECRNTIRRSSGGAVVAR